MVIGLKQREGDKSFKKFKFLKLKKLLVWVTYKLGYFKNYFSLLKTLFLVLYGFGYNLMF